MSVENKPELYTSLSPALLNLYDVNSSIVVIIDVLRATSTIAAALYNGAKEVIPVNNVSDCIQIGKAMNAITAGERDGKVAEGNDCISFDARPAKYAGLTTLAVLARYILIRLLEVM
jgi:2-phosphosulfolactate phosphatase